VRNGTDIPSFMAQSGCVSISELEDFTHGEELQCLDTG
jgi:hypothetical protein